MSQEFFGFFISWIKPIWAPDKQVKIRFRKDIRIWSLKNLTPRSVCLRGAYLKANTKYCFWFVCLFVNLSWFHIHCKGMERPAKTKLMPAKLRALLACSESDSTQCLPLLDFRKINLLALTLRSVSLRGVTYSLISPWKRIFQQNHFSLFIRGRGGLVS